MEQLITIKGNKDGLVLNAKPGLNYRDFFKAFRETVVVHASFFAGADIVGINNIDLSDAQKDEIKNFVSSIDDLNLVSFEYKKRETLETNGKPLKVSTKEVKKQEKQVGNSDPIINGVKETSHIIKEEDDMAETVFYRGTVRSGMKLESKSHILVVGDVNPGAELIADGNIVVMGILRGLAHAGADGSDDKIIAAWRLKPTQIRIADYITIPPDGEEDDDDIGYPEMAIVESERVIIRSYQ